MNQATIGGHLGADPEVRFTSSGQKVTVFRVAGKCRRTSKGDDVIWWRVSVWGDQFDKMISHFKKGSAIFLTGDMGKPEIFMDRDGKPQISMTLTAYMISFSPFGRSDSEETSHMSSHAQDHSIPHGASLQGSGAMSGMGREVSLSDEEIPF